MNHKMTFAIFILPLLFMSALGGAEEETANTNQEETVEASNNGNEVISYDSPHQESGFHTTVQFLYWQTLIDNLAYGVDQPQHGNGGDEISLEGHLKQNSYRHDPGIRAGVGYVFNPETFDVNLEYTYFHNEGGSSTNLREGRVLKSIYPNLLSPSFGPITNMSTKADLQYHMLDLYGAHTFQKTDQFLMRFLTGVRGAWLSQGSSSYYKTDYLLDPSIDLRARTLVQNNWKFSGCGLRAGLMMDWIIFGSLSMHAEGTLSAIVGRFRSKQQIDESTGYLVAKTRPSQTRIIPSMQLILGLAWKKTLGEFGVKVFANWELNLWDDLSQTYMYQVTRADASSLVGSWVQGSVNIQGITAGFSAEF